MKLLLGVDGEGHYRNAARLLARLHFSNPEWHLVHVRSADEPLLMPLEVLEDGDAFQDEERRQAAEVIREATSSLALSNAKSILLEGAPAPALLEYADEIDADITAVGSRGYGRIRSILLGSVGRAVALGSHGSFLIARGDVAEDGPIKAVFATDFSPYAKRCLRLFCQMKPQGIGELLLLTATDPDMCDRAERMSLDDEAVKEGLSPTDYLERKGQESAARLMESGINARFELVDGFVSKAIEQSMQKHPADLVIMGAQGNGFMERVLMGSTSLDQAVASPYSTLILRIRSIEEH